MKVVWDLKMGKPILTKEAGNRIQSLSLMLQIFNVGSSFPLSSNKKSWSIKEIKIRPNEQSPVVY